MRCQFATTHSTNAANTIFLVHRNDAVALTCNPHTSRITHTIDECYGRFAQFSAVLNRHRIVGHRTHHTTWGIDDEYVSYHLRNGISVENLVAMVFRPVSTSTTITRYSSVDYHNIHNLVIVSQFLVFPIQVVFNTVNVIHIQFASK
ncbi:Uncharacterised protein [Chlamydia trachomatis]|nr:Uncharacterised protein [Chlamydia trachomatis]